MSIQADLNFSIRVVDQPTIAGASSPAVTYDAYTTREIINGSTNPSADAVTAFETTLSSGSATIDLTSVPATTGTQSMSGKSLRTLFLKADSENAGVISIQAGGTNGYPLFGSSGKITLSPGDSLGLRISTDSDVDGTHKTIGLSGTGTDSIQVQMTFG